MQHARSLASIRRIRASLFAATGHHKQPRDA